MKLYIENVAKVKRAEIEIEGITVIAGYNGTGKSTICKALYSLCNVYGQLNQNIIQSRNNSIYSTIAEWEETYNPEEGIFVFPEFAENFFDLMDHHGLTLESLNERGLRRLLREVYEDCSEEEAVKLFKSLTKVIQRPNIEYARFVIERGFNNCFSGQINALSKESIANISLKTEKMTASVSFKGNKLLTNTSQQMGIGAPIYIETNSYLDMMMLQKNRKYNTIKIPTNVLEDTKKRELTLEQYEKINEIKEISNKIISEVTHGELIAIPNKSEVTYQENGLEGEIRCGNIASGLKNILFIQKMLENGRLNADTILIIDEPEVNLHPEWQVRFADILVQINKRLGIKVVLNTHSPYFMRAVEVKLAENEQADKGRYYLMTESLDGFTAQNVTGMTECVYETMYQPLEDL